MTQADSAPALRMSLDSEPAGASQALQSTRQASCCVCGNLTSEPVLIGCEEAGSGPGYNYLACPPHAAGRRL